MVWRLNFAVLNCGAVVAGLLWEAVWRINGRLTSGNIRYEYDFVDTRAVYVSTIVLLQTPVQLCDFPSLGQTFLKRMLPQKCID